MMHDNLQPIKSHTDAAYYFSTTAPVRGLDKHINGVPIHMDRREGRKKVLYRNDDGSYSAKLVYDNDHEGAPPVVTWWQDGRFTLHGQSVCQTTVGFMEAFAYQQPYMNYLSFTNSVRNPDSLVITLLPKKAPHQWVRNYINHVSGGEINHRGGEPTLKYVAVLGCDENYEQVIDGGMTDDQHNCPRLYTKGDITFESVNGACKVWVDDVTLQYVELVDKSKAYKLREVYRKFVDYIEFFTSVPLSYEAVHEKANYYGRKHDAESMFEAIALDPENIEAWTDVIHLYHETHPYNQYCTFQPKRLKKEFFSFIYEHGNIYSRTFRPIGPEYSTAMISDVSCSTYYNKHKRLPS